jgi:hypothetical protein
VANPGSVDEPGEQFRGFILHEQWQVREVLAFVSCKQSCRLCSIQTGLLFGSVPDNSHLVCRRHQYST